ncbi:DUF4177 domain-containing protein [Natronococcus sp. A-GB7]|uniref:DUF4177 domain-containing protein n=1 Tax=Natronococcus sp. A-GB7 TaxID=3037649 RepID=UPI00241F6C2F|nr:DUF4177 domain-containing protein [Natronococcus sp. A-GB7]MDG5821913.1 DUF4177 domain-containing protein [Natronococcus sp. A-GB7]
MTTGQGIVWKYETVRPPRGATMEEASDPKELLNEYGQEGWEFVSTIEYTGGGTKYLVFKRPADGDGNE